MKNTNLLEFLEKKDEVGYATFLKSLDIGKVTENEEAEFVRKAPPTWVEAYVMKMYPYPRSERCLMVNLKYREALKICDSFWGLYTENVLWAFQNVSAMACHMLIDCLSSNPGVEVEKAMIARRSTNLLKSWLKKFPVLSEDGERQLHESQSLLPLKLAYMEQQRKLVE